MIILLRLPGNIVISGLHAEPTLLMHTVSNLSALNSTPPLDHMVAGMLSPSAALVLY